MAATPVTHDELKMALAALQTQLVEQMEKQETRQREQMEKQETRLLEHMEKQEARLMEFVLVRIEKSETSLLLAFRKWAVKADGKFKVHDLLLSTAEERLDMLEHRLDDLEQRGQA